MWLKDVKDFMVLILAATVAAQLKAETVASTANLVSWPRLTEWNLGDLVLWRDHANTISRTFAAQTCSR